MGQSLTEVACDREVCLFSVSPPPAALFVDLPSSPGWLRISQGVVILYRQCSYF